MLAGEASVKPTKPMVRFCTLATQAAGIAALVLSMVLASNVPSGAGSAVATMVAGSTVTVPKNALPRLIQSELKRVGCLAGPTTHRWDRAADQAARAYLGHASPARPVAAPSADLLNLLLRESRRVCPSACAPGKIERNGLCVAATRPAQPVAPSPGTDHCFSYSGQTYCR